MMATNELLEGTGQDSVRNPNPFGDWLREQLGLRLGPAWTLREAQALSGVGKSSLSGYLSGEARPSRKNIFRLAKAFCIPVQALFDLTEAADADTEQDYERERISGQGAFQGLTPEQVAEVEAFIAEIRSRRRPS